jgi:hypothetical protein
LSGRGLAGSLSSAAPRTLNAVRPGGSAFAIAAVTRRLGALMRGCRTMSCGCLRSETVQARTGRKNPVFKHGHSGRHDYRLKHGSIRNRRKVRPAPEYNSWSNARRKCSNPRHQRFHLYGALGIKVCERWNRFENFLADMGSRPSPSHVLDRYDRSDDFTPDNTMWVSRKEACSRRA